MPTYQYACTNAECGLRFEQVQSFTDAAITDCPQCADKVRKVYGSVGVVFKGSGFYRTDNRESSSSPTTAEAQSESKSDSSSKDSSSSSSSSSSGSAASTSSAPAVAAAAS